MSKQIPFTSADGASNILQLFRSPSSKHSILIAPAMGVPARNYLKIAEAFQARGYNAAVFDLRGVGNSSIRASRSNDFGYFEIIEHDYSAAISTLIDAVPGTTLSLFGHSLGGQLACLYLSQNPDAAKNIILCASCSVYHKGWKFPTKLPLLGLTQLAGVIARILGYFPGRKLGFAGLEARSVMLDWAANARNGRYNLRNTQLHHDKDLKQVQLPVLAITFSDDNLAPLPATQQLLKKLSSQQISYVEVNANELGQKTADHFNWTRSPEVIADRVSNYLSSVVDLN